MLCLHCQHENPSGMFCGECGARLQVVCPGCKAANPPTNKFCGECGERLAAAPQPHATLAASPFAVSPGAYTPKHLAERILSSRFALEGERKWVTVLFADIKGSTELIQSLDPEDARSQFDETVQVMLDAVHSYEGTVNQIMGDGIMG